MAKGKKVAVTETQFPCFNHHKWEWVDGEWTGFHRYGLLASIEDVISEQKHALRMKYEFANFPKYPTNHIIKNIMENVRYRNSHFLLFWLNKLVEYEGYCIYNYVYKNELALGTKPNEAERRAAEAQKKLIEEFE